MFDELYADETEAAARAEIESPTPTVRRRPGLLSGVGSALLTGPTQGVLETGRNAFNVLSEYGKAAAFREGASKEESIDRMLTEESPEAKRLGKLARSYDPDPETASTAAQLVHGVGRIAVKAIGYTAAGGAAAPLLLGADEGATEAMNLTDKGVDAGTAAKAGLVRGVSTAIGAALPVAAATKVGTLGAVVAGGPALNMADKSTIRDILDAGGYDHLLSQYDPYNLTENVLATVPGAIFGIGAHVRRAGRAAAPGAAPAQGETAPGALRPSDDAVAAARVQALVDHDMALVRGEGAPAVVAHVAGREDAARRINAGETALDTAPPASPWLDAGPPRPDDAPGARPSDAPAPLAVPARAESEPATPRSEPPAPDGTPGEPIAPPRPQDPAAEAVPAGGRTTAAAPIEGTTVDVTGFDRRGDPAAPIAMAREDALRQLRAQAQELREVMGELTGQARLADVLKAVEARRQEGSASTALPGEVVAGLARQFQRDLRAARPEVKMGLKSADAAIRESEKSAVSKYLGIVERDLASIESKGSAAQVRDSETSTTASPEVRRAEAALQARGDFMVELEDGTKVSARQLLDEAKREVEQATIEARAFRVAAECALGGI